MSLFIHIFITTMLPIFLLISVGYVLDHKFNLDAKTLSKMIFYVLLPIYIFRSFYLAEFKPESIGIVTCAIAVVALHAILGEVIGKILGLDVRKTQIFKNGTMFNNCGNIGIAIATFVFNNDPYLVGGKAPYLEEAILTVLSILIINNIGSNTLGFYYAGIGRLTRLDAIKLVFKMPMIYMVPLAFICKAIPYDLTQFFLWPSLNFFGDAFIAIAMITLGLQINRTSFNFFHPDVLWAAFTRLIIGPILAFLAVTIYSHVFAPLGTISAQTLVIAYGVPSAMNTALIALEMKNNPEFATQIVMSTVLLSSITMPFIILAAYHLFPL